MNIFRLKYPFEADSTLASGKGIALAIGYFDGVHIGHQAVIGRAIEAARHTGLRSAVMTFDPHPKEVLGLGERYSTALTPLDEKLRRFEALGVDAVFVVRFDPDFASVTAEQFVSHVLHPLGVKHVVIGFDFRFGSKGTGTPALLSQLGAPEMEVQIVEPLSLQSEKISSSRIREALIAGDMQAAELLLGRPYRIEGVVVTGEQRGRTIGFPTANVEPDGNYLLPRLGVYAVRVETEGQTYDSVLNLGVKPTFHEGLPSPKLEAHLFDFSGDLYGKRLTLEFRAFLRPERKFVGAQQLVEQIRLDAETARSLLR